MSLDNTTKQQGSSLLGSIAPWTPVIGELGGSLLQGLAGESKMDKMRRRYARQGGDMLLGMRGKEIYDPYQVSAFGRRSIASGAKSRGAQIDRSLGLDTGQGQGALWGGMLGDEMALLMKAMTNERLARSQRDLGIGQSLLSMGR